MQNQAIIDLGSNSFKLLVGRIEGNNIIKEVEDKRFVQLSDFGSNSKNLAEHSCLNALKELIVIAEESDCRDVQLIATSFFRDTENEKWLRNILKKEGLDYQLKVVSGEEEAGLIAEGVLREVPDNDFLIMDIGGGSIEFISIKNREVENLRSFDIGVRRWAEKYDASEGLSSQVKSEIFYLLDQEIKDDLLQLKSSLLVGAAGSFETFYSVVEQQDFNPLNASNYKIQIEVLSPYLNHMIHDDLDKRKNNPFIEKARVNFIPFAALITQYVIRMTSVHELKLAVNALKEGALSR